MKNWQTLSINCNSMIFPFGIEKEAEIYCNSAKYEINKQQFELESQINFMADNFRRLGINEKSYKEIIGYIVFWSETMVKQSGWDIRDEDGAAWWIGLYTKSYLRAVGYCNHTFEDIFKQSFIQYFHDK